MKKKKNCLLFWFQGFMVETVTVSLSWTWVQTKNWNVSFKRSFPKKKEPEKRREIDWRLGFILKLRVIFQDTQNMVGILVSSVTLKGHIYDRLRFGTKAERKSLSDQPLYLCGRGVFPSRSITLHCCPPSFRMTKSFWLLQVVLKIPLF